MIALLEDIFADLSAIVNQAVRDKDPISINQSLILKDVG